MTFLPVSTQLKVFPNLKFFYIFDRELCRSIEGRPAVIIITIRLLYPKFNNNILTMTSPHRPSTENITWHLVFSAYVCKICV